MVAHRFLYAILLVLLVSAKFVRAGKIYWSDRRAGKVERANLDGTNPETLVTIASTNLRGLAIDVLADRLYIADNQSDKIFSAPLKGGATEELVSGLGFPADLELDLANRKLYWCDQSRSHIRRSNLDGSNIELILETPNPYYLDLDLANNHLYWGGFSNGTVNRVQLDGSNPLTLVSNVELTRGVKLDFIRGYFYWCDRQGNVVQRRKINGPPTPLPNDAVETIVTGLDTPHGLALDPIARKAYWFDTGTDGHGVGGKAISRADMDLPGSPIETIAGLNQPWDGDLDLSTHTYGDWDARFFLISHQGADIDPKADLDDDGLNHILEYGLTGHPERRDEQPLYEIAIQDGTAVFQYQRFSGTTDLTHQLETSNDLVTWTTSTSTETAQVLDNGVERVSIPVRADEGSHLRLRITLEK